MAKNKITATNRKGKVKDVIDMSNAKKKLHEMVEALIGGDSKTAAAALHEYLQQKTRTILGEEHGDMDMDMEAGEGDHDDMGDEFGGDEEFDGEEKHEHDEHCEDGCDLGDDGDEEGSEHGEEHDEFSSDDSDFGDEEGSEHGEEHDEPDFGSMHESNTTRATKQKFEKNTASKLARGVKGNIKFAGSGKGAKLTKPFTNAAPHLDRKVKGKLNFEKSSGVGTKKQNSTEATATFKGSHTNAAKDLGRKVKGNIKFSKSKPNKNV